MDTMPSSTSAPDSADAVPGTSGSRRRSASRRPGGLRALRRSSLVAAALGLGLAFSGTTSASAATGEIQPVPYVDVQKYLGSWKQIADIPQFYEAFCAKNTTATYSLNADGTVKVDNTCKSAINTTIRTVGGAKVLDPGTNARLQVSFINLFGKQIYNSNGPNYVIIGLPSDYSWAVVGSPDRTTAYILSRTATLTGAKLDAAKAALTRSGYDPCSLTLTKQTGGSTTGGKLC